MNEENKGNLTTIIKFLVMTIAPYIGVSEAGQSQLISIIVAVIGFIIAYWDAKYTNTLINDVGGGTVVTDDEDGT